MNIPVKDNIMILHVQQWRPLAKVRKETESPGSRMTFLHIELITRKSIHFTYHLSKLPIIKVILAKSTSANSLLIPL